MNGDVVKRTTYYTAHSPLARPLALSFLRKMKGPRSRQKSVFLNVYIVRAYRARRRIDFLVTGSFGLVERGQAPSYTRLFRISHIIQGIPGEQFVSKEAITD